MPARTQSPLQTILAGLFIIGLLSFLYHNLDQAPVSPDMANQDSTELLSQLHISLAQASQSPPAISIKVTNNSPGPVTILTWESPLDQQALSLGLLRITPSGSSEPLQIDGIMVSRKLPPDDDCLVTLAPGESRENEVVLRDVFVPAEKLKGKASAVEVKGRWMAVWPKPRGELAKEDIDRFAQSGGGAVSGTYASDSIEIRVD